MSDTGPVHYWCPVDAPMSVLGGKWKLVILYYLLHGPRRNGELRRLVPPITQKMLTQQLRELEDDGIVIRTVHEQVPPKVVYSVHPDERRALEPLVDALCTWGLGWAERTGATIDVFAASEGGKETFPPSDPPIFGAPDRQQSLPILRTKSSASVSVASDF